MTAENRSVPTMRQWQVAEDLFKSRGCSHWGSVRMIIEAFLAAASPSEPTNNAAAPPVAERTAEHGQSVARQGDAAAPHSALPDTDALSDPAPPRTDYPAKSALPLSAEQIEGSKNIFGSFGQHSFHSDLCDQALAALDLARQLSNSRQWLTGEQNVIRRLEQQVAQGDAALDLAVKHGLHWKAKFEKAEQQIAEKDAMLAKTVENLAYWQQLGEKRAAELVELRHDIARSVQTNTELLAELAEEKKLSEAISRDCNATALERNELRAKLAKYENAVMPEEPLIPSELMLLLSDTFMAPAIRKLIADVKQYTLSVSIYAAAQTVRADENVRDAGCVCRGNWRDIVNESETILGRDFKDRNGEIYRFFGLVWSDDDFYYGMFSNSNNMRLLSCVGSIDGHGFTLIEEIDAAIRALEPEHSERKMEG